MSLKDRRKFFKDYFDCLLDGDKLMYQKKYLKYVGFDPYEQYLDEYSTDPTQWPSVQFPDISMYLIHTTNSVTLTEMKNYKSMDAHTFLTSGNISNVYVKNLDKDLKIVLGKVKHSQKANDDYLHNWIVAKGNGEVITAHCSCMAGLGESCSHVGAILYLLDAGVTILKNRSSTEKLNTWLVPHMKQVPFKRARDINFSSAKQRKKDLERLLIEPDTPTRPQKKKQIVPNLTDGEFSDFLECLASSKSKPVILSLINPYNKAYVPKSVELPPPLTSFHQSETSDLPLPKILEICDTVKDKITITKEQSDKVELLTREQANCKVWYSQKAGRISSSNAKSVCHTDLSKPSVSLLKTICHPEITFTSKATDWGKHHEDEAAAKFLEVNKTHHEGLTMRKSGFVINPNHPFMGASPDRILSCKCCGTGTLEIKAPYSGRELTIEEFSLTKYSSLKYNEAVKDYKLDVNHAYYYQVQLQMFVCESKYSDFMIWTPKDLKIERILPNVEFCNKLLAKASQFFHTCILPELVSKFFTSSHIRRAVTVIPQNILNGKTQSNLVKTYCYCGKGEEGKMIACDNENCPYQWFHFQCVGMKKAPRGKWFCPECKKPTKKQPVK